LKCLEVQRLCELLLGKVNVNAISDLGVAASSAHTGLEGALMNVAINLPSIKDVTYTSSAAEESTRWRAEGEGLKDLVARGVEAVLSGR
jgi:formiminotetrahydrofolate cyclodeaminase